MQRAVTHSPANTKSQLVVVEMKREGGEKVNAGHGTLVTTQPVGHTARVWRREGSLITARALFPLPFPDPCHVVSPAAPLPSRLPPMTTKSVQCLRSLTRIPHLSDHLTLIVFWFICKLCKCRGRGVHGVHIRSILGKQKHLLFHLSFTVRTPALPPLPPLPPPPHVFSSSCVRFDEQNSCEVVERSSDARTPAQVRGQRCLYLPPPLHSCLHGTPLHTRSHALRRLASGSETHRIHPSLR